MKLNTSIYNVKKNQYNKFKKKPKNVDSKEKV